MNIAQKVIHYLKLSKAELKKVSWPDRKTTMNHTIMVAIISISVAFFLAIVDYFFNLLLTIVQ